MTKSNEELLRKLYGLKYIIPTYMLLSSAVSTNQHINRDNFFVGIIAILTAVIAVNAAGYLGIFLTRNLFCLVPMAVVSAAAGIVDPLVSGALHHQAESNVRATAESFSSLGLRIISVLVGLVFGYISTRFTIFTGFAALCLCCLVYMWFFISQVKKGKPIYPYPPFFKY